MLQRGWINMAKNKVLVSYSAKEIIERLDDQNKKIISIIEKMDNRVLIVEQKVPFLQKLIMGSYFFGMAILGFLISHLAGV